MNKIKRKKVWNASLFGLLILLVMGMSVFYFSTSDIKANSVSSFEVEEDSLKDEEIRFSIDAGEYLEVKKNENFSIEVTTNQTIDSLRIIVPKDAEFSFSDEKERTHIQTYDDESSLWLVEFNQKNDSFPATLSVLESGQVSVEDAAGDINSAFLFLEVSNGGRSEMSGYSARSSVNATSVATFRNAWNNSSTTQINVNSSISLTAAQVNNLDTRVTNVTLLSQSATNTVTARDLSILPISFSATLTLSGGRSNHVVSWGSMGVGEPIDNFMITTGHVIVTQGAYLRYRQGSNALSLTLRDGAVVQTQGSVSIQTLNLVSGSYVGNDMGSFLFDTSTSVSQSQNIRTLNVNATNFYSARNNGVLLWRNLVATVSGDEVTSSNHVGFTIERFGSLGTHVHMTDVPGIADEYPVEEIPVTQEYSLNLQAIPSEGGRPTASATTLGQGGTTTLTANPNSGYSFVRWEIVSGTGATIANPSSASTIFTMGSSNATVRAIYESNDTGPVDPPDPEPNPEGLTVVASPANGGSPQFALTGSILGMNMYTLSANTNPGFRFIRWELVSGSGSLSFADQEEGTTFILQSNAATVRAVYESNDTGPVDPPDPNPERFTVIASPPEGGSPDFRLDNISMPGTDIYFLQTTINAGFRFVRWEIVEGIGTLYNEYSQNNGQYVKPSGSDSTSTLRAVYEPLAYELKMEASPSTGGTPEAETYSIVQGETTTITANPNEGYDFIRWEIVSGTGSSISDENNENTTFNMGSADTTVRAVYETSNASLIVEFVDELGQLLPNYTVTIDAKLGDEIDLTTEATVVAQLDLLAENGYEIIERPVNEAAIKLIDAEMTVQYKVREAQGTISLTSVPNNFDFGTITYDATTKRIEAPAIDKPLIVTDSRKNAGDGWVLTASLSTPMENSEGQVLIDALRYVYDGQEMILDANAQTVYLSNERVAGSFDVSESWGAHPNTDGLKLQINSSDTIHTGDYVGVITWKVMAGQP